MGRNGGRAPAPSLREMLLPRKVLNPGGGPTFHLHRGWVDGGFHPLSILRKLGKTLAGEEGRAPVRSPELF